MHGLQEQLLGNLGHGHDPRGMLHPFRVRVRAEDVDAFVVGIPERLEAFVALLPVVQRRRHAVQTQEWVGDEFGLGPDPGAEGVRARDMAVDLCG
jgi:hypothetical protein